MEMEVEPNSIDEKNDFLNRHDMAIGSINVSISPKIFHQVYEEKPSEDQASYYEESSTNAFAEICIPIIEDDVYSISDLFFEIHVEYIWHAYRDLHAYTFACTMHASQESHVDTFACTMHASQESKREPCTSDAILIFSEKHLQKQVGYLNSSKENIQFKKKIVRNGVKKVKL
jgi:hypothetical protein